VQLSAPFYNAYNSYVKNDLTEINNNVYICTAPTTGGTWSATSTSFELLGAKNQLFKVDLPAERFNYNTYYTTNDRVFWENKVYSAQTNNINKFPNSEDGFRVWGAGETYVVPSNTVLRTTDVNEIKATGATLSLQTGSTIVSGDTLNISFNSIDFGTYTCVSDTGFTNADEAILIGNMFNLNTSGYSCTVSAETLTFIPPAGLGSTINGQSFTTTGTITGVTTTAWSGGTDYIPKYYSAGDARCQQIISMMIDITLYHIHSRIAPRNIPDLRVKRYDDSIKWLKMCAHGDLTPNLLPKTPRQGGKIRINSNAKKNNTY